MLSEVIHNAIVADVDTKEHERAAIASEGMSAPFN